MLGQEPMSTKEIGFLGDPTSIMQLNVIVLNQVLMTHCFAH